MDDDKDGVSDVDEGGERREKGSDVAELWEKKTRCQEAVI